MTGQELKAWRTDRRLNQQRVAEILGVSQGAISLWEKGRRELPGKLLEMALAQWDTGGEMFTKDRTYADVQSEFGLMSHYAHNPLEEIAPRIAEMNRYFVRRSVDLADELRRQAPARDRPYWEDQHAALVAYSETLTPP